MYKIMTYCDCVYNTDNNIPCPSALALHLGLLVTVWMLIIQLWITRCIIRLLTRRGASRVHHVQTSNDTVHLCLWHIILWVTKIAQLKAQGCVNVHDTFSVRRQMTPCQQPFLQCNLLPVVKCVVTPDKWLLQLTHHCWLVLICSFQCLHVPCGLHLSRLSAHVAENFLYSFRLARLSVFNSAIREMSSLSYTFRWSQLLVWSWFRVYKRLHVLLSIWPVGDGINRVFCVWLCMDIG